MKFRVCGQPRVARSRPLSQSPANVNNIRCRAQKSQRVWLNGALPKPSTCVGFSR